MGASVFRVKNVPAPILKIGPYGYRAIVNAKRTILSTQQCVRASWDVDLESMIDSFKVTIFSQDSFNVKKYLNKTNKISDEIVTAFRLLKEDDVVLFNKIFANGPQDVQWELDPLVLTIKN